MHQARHAFPALQKKKTINSIKSVAQIRTGTPRCIPTLRISRALCQASPTHKPLPWFGFLCAPLSDLNNLFGPFPGLVFLGQVLRPSRRFAKRTYARHNLLGQRQGPIARQHVWRLVSCKAQNRFCSHIKRSLISSPRIWQATLVATQPSLPVREVAMPVFFHRNFLHLHPKGRSEARQGCQTRGFPSYVTLPSLREHEGKGRQDATR